MRVKILYEPELSIRPIPFRRLFLIQVLGLVEGTEFIFLDMCIFSVLW